MSVGVDEATGGDSDASKRDAGQLYTIARAVLSPVFKFLWRIEVEGLEHVPSDGPAVLCPNHISFIDSLFLPAVLPRRITYVGKAEYLDSWKTKHLLPALGMIPIDRAGGDAAKAALDAASRVLQRGELFGIYPEGTRSRDGRLHKGHTGAARLALRNGCPIVPVGIVGTDRIQPADTAVPRPFMRAVVRFARPIDVSRYIGREGDHMLLRQLTDEVMYEIRELTGQEYVDNYATKRKAEDEPGAEPEPVEAVETGAITGTRRSSADVLGTRATAGSA
jgi:1-acyl-sn-glycerol-3-phosphate acyltransferase